MADVPENLLKEINLLAHTGGVPEFARDRLKALHKAVKGHAAEIERLRAALRSCPCPGGGWNGMPEGLEPTVGACADRGTCGCVYGAALHEQPTDQK